MILHQYLPLFLVMYGQFFEKVIQQLVYGVMLSHAQSHLLYKVQRHLDFSALEQACSEYHHSEGPGTPATHTVDRLLRTLVIKYLYDLSLRELEVRLYSDLLARWFVGYQLFDVLPDHSTLQRFEAWVAQEHKRLCFDEVLHQIETDFPDERIKIQIGDTYAMHAQAARENLSTLIRHTCIHVLESAVQSLPVDLTLALAGFIWTSLFGVYKQVPEFALSKEERLQRLLMVARAAYDFHSRIFTILHQRPATEFPELRKHLGYLHKILSDEFSSTEEVVQRLSPKQQGSFRIGSATDPEATYRVHGPDPEDTSFGYNIQLATSTAGFIHETKAYTGAEPDQSGVAPLVAEQKMNLGLCPPKLIYDQAAGSGKTRADVAQVSDGQTQLISRLLPYEKRTSRFGPYDFSLSQDGASLTCPNGKVSQVAYRAGSGEARDFRFFDFQCWSEVPPIHLNAAQADISRRCPLWEKCRDSHQGPRSMRQVFISDYRDQVLAAQQYNQTEAFLYEMKIRSKIERVVFELTHYNGARRCRKRGLHNADWQSKMCATAYNIKLWMRRLYSPVPRRAARAF
jgi:hypothetical protein